MACWGLSHAVRALAQYAGQAPCLAGIVSANSGNVSGRLTPCLVLSTIAYAKLFLKAG